MHKLPSGVRMACFPVAGPHVGKPAEDPLPSPASYCVETHRTGWGTGKVEPVITCHPSFHICLGERGTSATVQC